MENFTVLMQTDEADSYAGIRHEPMQLQRYNKLYFVSTSMINLLCKTKSTASTLASLHVVEMKRVNKSFVIASYTFHQSSLQIISIICETQIVCFMRAALRRRVRSCSS